MEALYDLSDTIFALKDKLTDAEFKMSDDAKTIFEKIKAYEEKIKTEMETDSDSDFEMADSSDSDSDSDSDFEIADSNLNSDFDSDSDSDFEIEEEVVPMRTANASNGRPVCPMCQQRCHLERVRLNGRSQQHMTCGNTEHPILRWLGGRAQGDKLVGLH